MKLIVPAQKSDLPKGGVAQRWIITCITKTTQLESLAPDKRPAEGISLPKSSNANAQLALQAEIAEQWPGVINGEPKKCVYITTPFRGAQNCNLQFWVAQNAGFRKTVIFDLRGIEYLHLTKQGLGTFKTRKIHF